MKGTKATAPHNTDPLSKKKHQKKDALDVSIQKLYETTKKLEHKSVHDLELEYANLKALFTILETSEFKWSDFEGISYKVHSEAQELELFSEKFNVHKIVRHLDFQMRLKISPYGFIDFLDINGAVNEKKVTDNKLIRIKGNNDEIKIPKIGEYYRDSDTGFWKVASDQDVEILENIRRESLYIRL